MSTKIEISAVRPRERTDTDTDTCLIDIGVSRFRLKRDVLGWAALRNGSFLAYLNPWRNNGSYWMAEIERTGKASARAHGQARNRRAASVRWGARKTSVHKAGPVVRRDTCRFYDSNHAACPRDIRSPIWKGNRPYDTLPTDYLDDQAAVSPRRELKPRLDPARPVRDRSTLSSPARVHLNFYVLFMATNWAETDPFGRGGKSGAHPVNRTRSQVAARPRKSNPPAIGLGRMLVQLGDSMNSTGPRGFREMRLLRNTISQLISTPLPESGKPKRTDWCIPGFSAGFGDCFFFFSEIKIISARERKVFERFQRCRVWFLERKDDSQSVMLWFDGVSKYHRSASKRWMLRRIATALKYSERNYSDRIGEEWTVYLWRLQQCIVCVVFFVLSCNVCTFLYFAMCFPADGGLALYECDWKYWPITLKYIFYIYIYIYLYILFYVLYIYIYIYIYVFSFVYGLKTSFEVYYSYICKIN